MVTPAPRNANEFIEQALDERAMALSRVFEADILGFAGPLIFNVDDIIRDAVERMCQGKQRRNKLVVVLTTSGGYINVVQRVVETFRYHYDTVEFVVPNYAYSAGTVLAMSGNAIHMNYYSRLGPIDPQVNTIKGMQVPALGYLVQWERLVKKAQRGKLTTAEMQLMIDGFDQAQLYQFEQAKELSIALLKEWLATYKFKDWLVTKTRRLPVDDKMRKKRAEEIARELSNPNRWHSHGYGISMEVLRRDLNVRIDDFDAKPKIGAKVKDYHGLLDDYMARRGNEGVVHTINQYFPFGSG